MFNSIPKEFKPKMPVRYPVHQRGPMIEEFAAQYFSNCSSNTRLRYLPIQWTAYHLNHDYGKNIDRLREFVGNLPRKIPVYTVVQYDDGTLCDDLLPEGSLVFGSGGVGDVPIPLLCDPHKMPNKNVAVPNSLAVFMGNLKTHPVREKMKNKLSGYENIIISGLNPDFTQYFVKSNFVLCPRGYGKTSFRMYEALSLGCIPVYIYDEPWIPMQDVIDWGKISVLCHESKLSVLYQRLMTIEPMWQDRAKGLIKQYSKWFTMKGVCEWISRVV